MIRNWHWDNRGRKTGVARRRSAPGHAGAFVQLGNAPRRNKGIERGFSGLSRGHFPASGAGPNVEGRQGVQDTAAPSIRVHGMVLPSRRKARHPDPLRNTPRVRNSSAEGLGGDRSGRPGSAFGRGMGPNFRLS